MSFRWLYNSRREAPGDILCKKTSFINITRNKGKSLRIWNDGEYFVILGIETIIKLQ